MGWVAEAVCANKGFAALSYFCGGFTLGCVILWLADSVCKPFFYSALNLW